MRIETKDFGIIEVDDGAVFRFVDGIYGFDGLRDYALFGPEGYPIKWLQSINDSRVRFILADPFRVMPDYNPRLRREDLERLGASRREDLVFYAIAVVPERYEDMTVNLKSPLAFNMDKKIAAQVILENRDYLIRQRYFGAKAG